MWMEVYRNGKSYIRAKYPHVSPMEGVATRSCTASHQHPPGIKQTSPETLALPRVYRGTRVISHYPHLIPTKTIPRTRLVFLAMQSLGLFRYDESLLPALLQGTKLPWETHRRRGFLHFRLPCATRVAPNLALPLDKKAGESANKGRIFCFDWCHDDSFIQLLSLEAAFC